MANTQFQDSIILEIKEVQKLGVCTAKIAKKAIRVVEQNAHIFSDDSGMRTSEAADLALDHARIV